MRKYSLWALLFSMFTFMIVDDDGIGGGDDDDIGDFDIEDEETESDNGAEEESKENEPPDGETQTELEKRLAELEAREQAREAEAALNAAIGDIKTKYPDFDPEKVAQVLSKMPKEEQERLNNPLGWELIYRDNFQRNDDRYEDPFDPGRKSSKEPYDFEKGLERARGGDKKAIAELLENSI